METAAWMKAGWVKFIQIRLKGNSVVALGLVLGFFFFVPFILNSKLVF